MFSKNNLNGQKQGPPSLISENLHIKGNLQSEGEIQIDGKVDGDVTALSLTIGEKGIVNGEIISGTIMVRGKVKGQIRSQEVQLTKSAHVTGDIHHDTLGIESGAFVEGLCKRSKRPLENIDNGIKQITPKKIQPPKIQNSSAKPTQNETNIANKSRTSTV